MELNRRQFLEFLSGSVGAAFIGSQLSGCSTLPWSSGEAFPSLKPSDGDELLLAEGFSSRLLISWDEKINKKDRFGFNNDFIALTPLPGASDSQLMWVNHEYVDPLFVGGEGWKKKRSLQQVRKEMLSVGGSLLKIDKKKSEWSIDFSSSYNRRITSLTPISFSNGEKIQGKSQAIGTLCNCAGGKTPWNTILTCEENYDKFYGEVKFTSQGKREVDFSEAPYGWQDHYPYPPEHYGWVVEVDPLTGRAVKHTGIGRYAHECATTTISKSGELVVYSGDDADNEHLYKFIAKNPKSLKEGTLYVASLEKGRWIPLDRDEDSRLKAQFSTQLELLIRTREAAKIVGATPLDRPEDIEIHPHTGEVFVALTNNKSRGNYFGSLLKIREKNDDASSLEFDSSTFMAGGEDTGFACPDNLAFDSQGGLWFTTDISGSGLNKAPYTSFKNNSLFYVPMKGKGAGKAHRVASGPRMSELTGPCFSPDGRTLFLSIQHPGERSPSLNELSSHWPHGGSEIPRPSVVAISLPGFVL